MGFFKKLNDNYFIYIILLFVLLPLNYIPQLWDGVSISYAFETGNLSGIEISLTEVGRYIHLYFFYFINFLTKYTTLTPEIIFDNLTIVFLILFCIEVKKYSEFFFNLEKKWSNFAALFVAIFPVWHTLVAFDLGTYLSSFYFLLFGYRNFIKNKKINSYIGLLFVILSFEIQSNLSFVIGLAIVNLILYRLKVVSYFSYFKFILIVLCTIIYYLIRKFYFPSVGLESGGYPINLENLSFEYFNKNGLVQNIFNYSTYLLTFIWIPILFYLNLIFLNKKYFLINKIKINVNSFYKYFSKYILLLILSAFAVFPYLLLGKSSSIFYLGDYYQRHAFLLAPISGIFFASMFRDLSLINNLKHKVNLKIYLIIFVLINLTLLNYGNYRKLESHFFRENLVVQLKEIGSIPRGNVELVGKNIPADLRPYEISYIFYKAYNLAGWWGKISNSLTSSEPPQVILKKEGYSTHSILNDYKNECSIYVYLKNDLKKIDRIKKFYILNYRKHYNIDKILKKC